MVVSVIIQFDLNKQTFSCEFCKMFMNPIFLEKSGVILLFEHSSSRASEIDYFDILSRPRENQLARRFVVKFNLLLFFLILYSLECFKENFIKLQNICGFYIIVKFLLWKYFLVKVFIYKSLT